MSCNNHVCIPWQVTTPPALSPKDLAREFPWVYNPTYLRLKYFVGLSFFPVMEVFQ